MSRRLRPWALVLAMVVAGSMAGCASPSGPRTDAEICGAQADNDPQVKELLMKGAGNPHFLLDHQGDMRAARQDATTACLRSRGVIPAGGVERLKSR